MIPWPQQDTCRDRIFKLSPIHASVIFRNPELAEFSESFAIFRKNFIVLTEEFLQDLEQSVDVTGNYF